MPMIEINLLPKQFSKRSSGITLGKHGIYVIAGIAAVLMLFATVTGYQIYQIKKLEGQMEIARARTIQLQKDIQLVDALTDVKQKITDRLSAVERLDRHRSAWVRILEDLSRNVPDYVWLSKFEEIEDRATKKNTTDTTTVQESSIKAMKPAEIEGFTFTLNALAAFMIKMMRSDYFDDVDLVNTEEILFGRHTAYNFKLTCNVHYLSDEELEQLYSQKTSEKDVNTN